MPDEQNQSGASTPEQNAGQSPESTQTPEPVSVDRVSPETPASSTGSSRNIIIALVIIAILIGLGYYFLMRGGNDPMSAAPDSESQLGAVASVNGTEIPRADFDRSLSSLSQSAVAQGADTSDQQVRDLLEEQALTMVINNELLIQAAAEAGFTADEAEVNAQLETVESQFGGSEALKERMDAIGITEEDLRTDIERQLSVNAFVNSETNLESVTVTDEEINEFIASLNLDASNTPPIEEIRPQIEASLKSQKQQELIDSFIQSLRDNATIEVFM